MQLPRRMAAECLGFGALLCSVWKARQPTTADLPEEHACGGRRHGPGGEGERKVECAQPPAARVGQRSIIVLIRVDHSVAALAVAQEQEKQWACRACLAA